jgi:tellurite resistance protein
VPLPDPDTLPVMPLSPEQEWTLVACGLVAHADGILEAGEWDQVLWMLDEHPNSTDGAEWIELLSDRARLQAHADTLPLPPPFLVEPILEKAWRMALSDGVGSPAEVAVHDGLASKLQLTLTSGEIDALRSEWSERAKGRAEAIVAFAAFIATFDGTVDDHERAAYEALSARQPVDEARRVVWQDWLERPPRMKDVVADLVALDPEDRSIALLGLLPLVQAGSSGARERLAFLDLAQQAAIPREDAERMLQR